jgi:DNA ligase-1
LEETTHSFPELVQGLLDQIDADSVILDSEALAYHVDSQEFFPFQETTKRRRKYGIEEMAAQLPLRAFVFDILYKNGESLLDLPVRERLEILENTVKKNVSSERADTLIVSESRFIDTAEPLGLMLEEALTSGLEGLVIKKVDSPYEAGARNFNWVKLKHTASEQLKDTVDCVVLGYIYGRGKRVAFGVGALLVGLYDKERDVFVSVSKIGTGLTDAEWVEVRERCDKLVSQDKPARIESDITPSVWVEPEVVIEVLADEITRSPLHTAGRTETEPGYALRFPRLVSFRDADKRPEDATNVMEIKELYSMQGKKE